MGPQLIFGTASFGMPMTEFQDSETVKGLLRTLGELGITRLDSGARYPPLNPGRSEELIGEAKELSREFLVDTKIYTDTATDGSGDLTVGAMAKSVDGSLKRLQADSVNVLHIHRADPATPLEEQVHNFNDQITQGHCKKWGVSNVSPQDLERMIQICEENGLQKPSCYQGVYNLVTRGMETKLLPLLRAHGIVFNGFQPLAAGFLTGKVVNNEQSGTRFGEEHPLGAISRRMFGGEDLLNAMKKFDTEVKAQGFTPAEIAVRWLMYHSDLGDDDGIVLGASKVTQIIETVNLIRRGPLPETILLSVDELWGSVKGTRGEII
ncbi:putative oxidoreductase [Daldinia vernicosa]|uniref:putative oxidoreductase n=1 Tax=Daldinia vernicosa TaxID=114800 RepID=UPI0020084C1A|nr:putative oxidoreductase [Daldinia vernicosa]KAI0850470.1 putative oxidoreductase [Daldinia vernicosa]